MPDRHAWMGGSNAKQGLACTPSIRLCEKYPDETTTFAEEGTRAHALCEWKLHELLGDLHLEVKPSADDMEMERCTEDYKDFVEEELNAAKAKTPDAKLFIEQEFDLDEYIPESFGTSDAVIISDDTLEVIDFKYGKGVQVDATENTQLRLYALGSYTKLGSLYDFSKVKTVIFQPRLNHISYEELELSELLDWAESYVKPRAKLAYAGEGEFVVGEHCRFCKAGAHCRARASAAFEVIDKSDKDPALITDEEIAPILEKLDNAEKWIASIREYAKEEALKGKKWPGFKLVEGRSIRKIPDQISASNALQQAGYAQEDYTTVKLKGITDLEKLLGKAKFTQLLGQYVVKPHGEPTLVKESDKREEINPLDNMFKED